MNVAQKLGLNTTSLTKPEAVSTGRRIPKYTWFGYFRLAQGDKLIKDRLIKDNRSAILLRKNWPFFSTGTGKGSKHINVRRFFVVDKSRNKEVRIIHHRPTEEVIADYNTKPVQGMIFVV